MNKDEFIPAICNIIKSHAENSGDPEFMVSVLACCALRIIKESTGCSELQAVNLFRLIVEKIREETLQEPDNDKQ